MKRISTAVAILVIATLTIASVMYFSNRNYMMIQENVIQMEQNQLLTLVETVADSIERFFLNRQRELEIISKNDEFIGDCNEYLEGISSDTQWQQLRDYYNINNKQIDNVGVVDYNGKTVFATPYALDSEYFTSDIKKMVATQSDLVGEIYNDHGELFLNIIKRVNGESGEGMLLYSRIRLLTVYGMMVEPVRAGEKGYVSVKDASGVIIMHPNTGDIGQNVLEVRKKEYPDFDWSELESLVGHQLKGESGIGVYHSLWFTDDTESRVKKFNAYTPARIGDTFWVINISKDYLEVVSFLKEKTYSIVILNFIILILFVSLVLIYFRMRSDRKALLIQKKLSDEVSALNRVLEEDLEERKMQEETLRRSQERFRAIVQEVADSVVAFDETDSFEVAENPDKHQLSLELERINIRLERLFKNEVRENQRKEALVIYQSRLAAMGQMIGSIAHQWRQPLSAMHMLFNNLIDAYRHGEINEEFLNQQYDRMTKLTEYMSNTIDDFRFFFDPNIEPGDFLISGVVDRTLALLDDPLKQTGVDLTLKIESDCLIFGYENQLSQVLLSIIQNSIDVLKSEQYGDKRIRINVGTMGDTAIVTVEDNGGGVDDGNLSRLFEAYFTTKKKTNGTGLGLYIAKVIIEKNFYGQIKAENTGMGLRVTMQIPRGRRVV